MRRSSSVLAPALALFLCLCAVPGPVFGAFEDLPTAPRTTAMAASNVASADDLGGMFTNPAALATLSRWELFTTYEKMHVGLSDGSSLGRQVVAVGAPFRFGSLALGMDRFSLAGLYNENAMVLGYARRSGQKLVWGFDLRNLSVSYGSDQYTAENPVLKGGTSKSAMGLDLGVRYFGRSLTWAMAILNMNEPDLGIKYSNKVERKIDLGITGKLAGMDLNAALAKAGGDLKWKFGFERFNARRTLAMRAGINMGSRDWRNLAFGFGYAGRAFRFDYAVNLPFSGLSGTMGTHQFGMTFNWGRPFKQRVKPTRDETAADQDEESKSIVKAKPLAPSEDDKSKARKSLLQAKKDILGGNYRSGLDKMKGSDLNLISDEEIKELQLLMAKAETVAQIYPRLDGRDEKDRLVQTAISAYMGGDGKTAVGASLYAQQRWPDDARVAQLRDLVNRSFPLEAFEAKPLPGVTLVDQMLQESLELIYAGRYVAAVSKCAEILKLEPDNVMALTRTGSAYWAMGMEQEAREVWRKALKLEPANPQLLKFMERKSPEQTRRIPKKASLETEEEYRKSLAYYERLKRSGVEKGTLQKILKKMIEQFEGSGLDMTYVYKEHEALRSE